MHQNRYLTILLAIAFLANLQCRKESFITVYDVDQAFQPFIYKFIEEAASRGVVLEIDNLIMHYEDDLNQTFCGKCNSLKTVDQEQKEIRLKQGNGCWENSQELETLIFHELGHCILSREHLSDTLPNGDPKSLMIEGNVSVYAPCRYVLDQPKDCNNVHKRAYYMSELFDENTPVPDWAK